MCNGQSFQGGDVNRLAVTGSSKRGYFSRTDTAPNHLKDQRIVAI